MITVGGVLISDNMYLDGIESSPPIAYSQKRAITGESYVESTSLVSGRVLSLGSQNRDGANQGIWCKSTIDQISYLASFAIPVVMDYRGSMMDVLITEMDFIPLHQFEPDGPNKKFTGKITLIEV